MKKSAGAWETAFRCLFTISVWVTVIAASLCCIIEAVHPVGFTIFLFVYEFVSNVRLVAGFLSVLLLMALFAFRYLGDRNDPGYPGVVELGEKVSFWLLKFDIAYICVTVVKRLILLYRISDHTTEPVQGAVEIVCYLLQDGWLYLVLGAVLILIHTLCKRRLR